MISRGWVTLPIEKLLICEWNYKTNNKRIMSKLIENIKKNGFIENLIVREVEDGKFEVINGNHRLEALKHLKYKEINCYNFGKITLLEAKRIAIETNETKFENDSIKLAEMLGELVDESGIEDLIRTTIYEQEYLETNAAIIEHDWFDDSLMGKDIEDHLKEQSDNAVLKVINLRTSKERVKKIDQIAKHLKNEKKLDLSQEEVLNYLIDNFNIDKTNRKVRKAI